MEDYHQLKIWKSILIFFKENQFQIKSEKNKIIITMKTLKSILILIRMLEVLEINSLVMYN